MKKYMKSAIQISGFSRSLVTLNGSKAGKSTLLRRFLQPTMLGNCKRIFALLERYCWVILSNNPRKIVISSPFFRRYQVLAYFFGVSSTDFSSSRFLKSFPNDFEKPEKFCSFDVSSWMEEAKDNYFRQSPLFCTTFRFAPSHCFLAFFNLCVSRFLQGLRNHSLAGRTGFFRNFLFGGFFLRVMATHFVFLKSLLQECIWEIFLSWKKAKDVPVVPVLNRWTRSRLFTRMLL